jgi:hypothetical protein
MIIGRSSTKFLFSMLIGVGLSCPDLNLSILHIFKSMI